MCEEGPLGSLHSVETIDIEQPSFSSPQHAVVLKLYWKGSVPADTSQLKLGFSTKIHLRYPSPVADSSNLHLPIILVPPVMMEGNVTILQPVNGDASTIYSIETKLEHPHMLQHMLSSISTSSNSNNLEFLSTTVASAPEEDFVWVAGSTVLFSLLGAAFLAYETSRIAH